MLIFTNRPLSLGSAVAFSFATLRGTVFGDSKASFEKLLLARFFLKEQIGGQTTTGPDAVLL